MAFLWPGGPGTPAWFPRRLRADDTVPTVSYLSPTAGTVVGGTAVTITGTNFALVGDGSAPTVTFDGRVATSVVLVSATSLTCVSPVGIAGSVDVTVAVASQTGTLTKGWTYLQGAITRVSPAYGPIAGATSILITGVNFVTGSTITVGGIAATGVSFLDGQHYRCVTPAHAKGFTDIVITEPSGATVTGRNTFQYTTLSRTNDIRYRPGIVIRDVLNNAPNTCTFTIDGNSNAPSVGEAISITDSFDNNRLLFAGNIQTYDQIFEGKSTQLAWTVSAIDYTWLLNKYRPSGSYVQVSASSIVTDLIHTFAPDYSTIYVQQNLAPVTITFDGSKDMATCLSEIASEIGDGHWYVDYARVVHFFHVPPKNLFGTLPDALQTQLELVGTPLTVVTGSALSAVQSYDPGYYVFRHTFVYSDGSESALRACANGLFLDGSKQLDFSNLEVGAAAGSLTVTKRRVYMQRLLVSRGGLSSSDIEKFIEVTDNTTTTFSAWPGEFQLTVVETPTTAPTILTTRPYAIGGWQPRRAGSMFIYSWLTNGHLSAPSPFSAILTTTITDQLTFSGVSIGPAGTTARYIFTNIRDVTDGIFRFQDWVFLLAVYDNVTTSFTNPLSNDTDQTLTPPYNGPAGPLSALTFAESALSLTKDDGTYPGNLTTGVDYKYVYTFSAYPDHTDETAPSTASVATQTASGTLLVEIPAATVATGIRWIYCYRTAAGGTAPYKMLPAQGVSSTFNPSPYVGQSGLAAGITFEFIDRNADATLGQEVYTPSAASGVLASIPYSAPVPRSASTGIPAGPTQPPQAAITTTTSPGLYNGGSFQFRVAYLYRDGSVSYVSPASTTVTQQLVAGTGIAYFTVSNLPVAPTINGVDAIARIVYQAIGSAVGIDPTWNQTMMPVVIVADNTSTSVTSGWAGYSSSALDPFFGATGHTLNVDKWGSTVTLFGASRSTSTDPMPNWPNADGPDLEAAIPQPDQINDANVNTLYAPPFTKTTEASQIRNRVLVIGAGSTLVAAAAVGDISLRVADVTRYSAQGGTVRVAGLTYGYTGVEGILGAGSLDLASPVTVAIATGEPVPNFYQADDHDSQQALGALELDAGGSPTDGVHEYQVVDTSLTSRFQLFMRANAELERYSRPITRIHYATRDPKTRSGATVSVDLTNPPCQGNFLIQEVTIDQIRINGLLKPRYTAMADSAARFNFNDFLLALDAKGGHSTDTSLAGLVQAATVNAALDLTRKNAWAFVYNSSGVPTYGGVGCSPSSTGTTATFDQTEIPAVGDPADTVRSNYGWATHGTTAVKNNTSGVYASALPGQQLEESLDLIFYVRTGHNLAACLLWAGLQNLGNNIPTDKAGTNIALCAFRYLAGTDGGWVGVLQPNGVGHSQYVTGAVAGCAAGTVYKLRIRSFGGETDSTQTSVAFSVNDGPETIVTYAQTATVGVETPDHNMPIASGTQNASLVAFLGVCTQEAAIKKFSWRLLTMSAT